MRRTAMILSATALLCAACAEPTTEARSAEQAVTASTPAVSPAAAPEVTVEGDRLAALESRLAETERRLLTAEARAVAAEARIVDAIERGAPTVADDRAVETRTEDEIKAAATGVDDGADLAPTPDPPAEIGADDRRDPHKASAYNVDPLPDD